jgi:serpin B
MRRPLSQLLLVLVCTAPLTTMRVTAQKPTDAQRLVAACNQFAADLHGKLAPSDKPTCSPGSISIALLMLLPGARGNTAIELANVLHLPEDLRGERMAAAATALLEQTGVLGGKPGSDAEPGLLCITNDIWVQTGYELLPSYVDLVRRSFGAGSYTVDFAQSEAARERINSYIAKATNDRVKDLLPADLITPNTRVVLTNALWFKGPWEHPFRKENTKPAPFTLAGGDKVDVPTMQVAEHFAYAETDAWQCLAMPFDKGAVQCEIMLPRAGVALADAEAALLAGKYVEALRGERVQVRLPRFRVAAAHRLKEPLMALGMRDAFSDGAADFSGMDPKNDLVVTNVVHQTWIQVDEDGAEAAAATAVILRKRGGAPHGEPKVFTADRPFAFVLRDRDTGLILFVGRVTDPRPQQG